MIEHWFEGISREEALNSRLKITSRSRYYHSTSDIFLDNIKERGLCKRSVSGTRSLYYGELMPELVGTSVEDAIFVSSYPDISWAGRTCEERGGTEVYVYVTGRSIIEAGCKAYPDYGMLQPLDSRDRLIPQYVKDIMLLGCDCIKISGWNYFYRR
jgi:hypothetical protein